MKTPRLTSRSISAAQNGKAALVRVRKALGDQGGVQHTVLAHSALADDVVAIFHLAGVNVVDLLVGVVLAHPLGGAIVNHGPLRGAAGLADGQSGFIFVAAFDPALPAG